MAHGIFELQIATSHGEVVTPLNTFKIFGLGVLCSVNMFATRYSRTMMGKMLLEHLEAKNQPIDLAQVINTKYLLFCVYEEDRLS